MDLEAKVEVDNRIFSPAIGLSAEKETETNYNYNNRDNNRPSYRDRSRYNYRHHNRRNSYWSNERRNNYRQDNRGERATDKTIEIDKMIEEMTPDKDTEIGVKVGIDQELIVMTVLEVET